MAIENIHAGQALKVTCTVVYYINKGEIPAKVEGEVLIIDGSINDSTLVLKRGVVNNGVLTLN